MHPQYGLVMLTQLQAFEPRIREVAYLHHERLDGSGFPLGIKGDKIPPLARLIGLVDHYDELLHPRSGPQPAGAQPGDRPALQALPEEVRANPGQVADKGAGVYPPGSLVRLDDDALALVLSTEPSMPLRPKVLPYLKGQRPEGVAMIDLREDARSIVATLRQEELDDAQRAFSVWVGGSVTISPSELSPEAGDNSLDKPE